MQQTRYRLILLLLTTVSAFLYWQQVAPGVLNYHEQNQLFLFTLDHLTHALSLPGGLADYLAEAGMQLAYYPTLGALWMAIQSAWTFLLINVLLAQFRPHWGITSLLLTTTLTLTICHVRWTPAFPMALLLVLATTWLVGKGRTWLDLLILPLLYWVAGPVTWLYAAWRILTMGQRELWVLPYLALILLTAALTLTQWPWQVVLAGIHYRTDALQSPWEAHLLTTPILLTGLYFRWVAIPRRTPLLILPCPLSLLALLICCRPDHNEMEILRLDMLVRHGAWEEVIHRVEHHPVPSPFTSQCANLALGMTGQLPQRMFELYQDGPEGLLMPMVRDNMSDLPTAEAFFQLGMINEALRYTTDLQQSILTYKRSGRCTKRIAECHLINGHHTAAAKELQRLEQSLFYRSWAKENMRLVGRDNLIDQHPLYGRLRKLRFKENFLYNYDERHKMLGLLFVSNTNNLLALHYHMAQLLLSGDLHMLMQSMPWVQQYGGFSQMPATYRDALEYAQQKKSACDSPYGQYIERLKQANHSADR